MRKIDTQPEANKWNSWTKGGIFLSIVVVHFGVEKEEEEDRGLVC